ncbi:M56 family metallopeptidase [Lachnospiraceae bacterium 54-11]
MLLKMSLSGGILILLIALVRMAALNKLPKRMFMLLWSVALLRLLVPAELPLAWGIALPVVRAAEDIAGKIPASAASQNAGMVADNGGDTGRTYEKNTRSFAGGSAEGSPNQTAEKNTDWKVGGISDTGQNYTFYIWLAGAVTMLFILSALYIREYRKIREALPVEKESGEYLRKLARIPARVRLQVSDRIVSPVTFGIARPKIVLPKDLLPGFLPPKALLSGDLLPPENDGQLKFALIHEMVHIKRADNLRKMVMLLALCVHWFNPLVWLMYFLLNRDIELSCDEKVILLAGQEAKKEYAMALVNLAEKQYRFSMFSAGFGKNAVKERIVAIMNFKKITALGILCAVILTGMSVTVFASGGEGADAENTCAGTYAGTDGGWSVNRSVANSDDFSEYARFGLSYDGELDRFLYEGKIVGYFYDEKSPGVYTHLTENDGEVFLIVKRDSDNKITGFEQREGGPSGDTSEQPSGKAETHVTGGTVQETGAASANRKEIEKMEKAVSDTLKDVEQEYAAYRAAMEDRDKGSREVEEELRKTVKKITNHIS